jgi:large subunit ribosomal protein L21
VYAIVKTGGKQYRVEKGQTLLVERLPDDEGAKIALQPLLYRSDEAVFDGADLGKVRVEAKVVGHERGPKLRVFKFKPKRGYKRRTGHRQELTRIEVTDIKMGARRAATAKADSAADDAPAAAAEPAARTKPAGPKPQAKPAGAQAAPAKPAARATPSKPAAKPAAKPKPARKPRAPKPTDAEKES